jgi:hypothetical protein
MTGMTLKTTNKQVVEEVAYGMYVWELPDGEVLGDGEGNIMNCFVWERKDRPAAARAIAEAARGYGFPEGKAVWWSGKRQIDDEELEHQVDRAKAGLTPDPLDLAAIREDERNLGLRNG